jgi:octaprenyl-diphosphate synthase
MVVSASTFADGSRADVPLPTGWEEIVAPVRPFLGRVAERLSAQVNCFEPEIAGYARYALNNQGKQLRPALVALAGETVGPLNEELVSIAVIIEMIHLATLVHDDVMDAATVRRRQPTLAARWGNSVAVLVGDCLFAHALKLAADFLTTEVSRAVAESTGRVCTGEILQSHRRRRWDLTRADYYKVLEMKTAELFALACSLGARMAGGGAAEQEALRRHGLALGTAYQIFDDCLDVFGTEQTAGKSLGTDLATGKVTLPVLICLERATPKDRAELLGWLNDWQPGHYIAVRALLERYEVLQESAAVIDGFLVTARDSLAGLPPGPGVTALAALSQFLAQQTAALGG